MQKKIFVVEDDVALNEQVTEILRANNYKVYPYFEAQSALEKLAECLPDLIISDIMMPGKNGYDFITDVKNNDEYCDIPFIFLTAVTEYRSLRQGMNLGADDYIAKPFRIKELLNSIDLRFKKQALVEKKIDRVVNSIAQYVPHELRTPMVALLGYPQLILENKDSFSQDEITDFISRIQNSALRMQDTLEKFILLSDLEAILLGKSRNSKLFSNEPSYKINSVIGSTALQIAQKYERENDLELKIEEADSTLSSHLIEEIFKQLLDNSFKFSQKNTKVVITCKVINNEYAITIKDLGIGMSPKEISSIGTFVQFNRENYNQDGNGIGLSFVKRILEFIGKELYIKSTLTKGTMYQFNLKLDLNL